MGLALSGLSGLAFCASGASGLTCPAAIPLTSGVPVAVNVPTDETRWYRLAAPADGLVSLGWEHVSGESENTDIYTGPDCDNQTLIDAGQDSSGSWSAAYTVDAGYVWVKFTNGSPLIGTLTATFNYAIQNNDGDSLVDDDGSYLYAL